MPLLPPLDHDRLGQALQIAEQAIGVSDPNPRVGCVLGSEDGRVFGVGSTQRAGEAHAEVMALRSAAAAGVPVEGSTAWVSLEPCAHHGRTPPCCDALIEAGVKRVVIASADPFPQVDGAGIARLLAAGVEVLVADGPLADQARELNIGFFSRVERGRPWLRMKVAVSLDGRTALNNGASRWITSQAARVDGHRWRKRASAIVTGIGTVLADNPRMDVRLVPTSLQPMRVIVDTHFRTPVDSLILAPPGVVLIAGTASADPRKLEALWARAVETLILPTTEGKVDPAALLAELARRHCNEVHLEAGSTLNAAFLKAGLVDEVLCYLAPKLIGAGRPMATLGPFQVVSEALPLHFFDLQALGVDLLVRARTAPSPQTRAIPCVEQLDNDE